MSTDHRLQLEPPSTSKSGFGFDLVSDTHLEFYKKPFQMMPIINKILSLKTSHILCLAGDIGYPKMPLYQLFLEKLLEVYKYVLVVSGNHEYYNADSYDKLEQKMNDICESLNQKSAHTIIYLQRKSIKIDDYLFLGCTLWTHLVNHDQMKQQRNDFRKIHKKGYVNHIFRKVPISTYDVNLWHQRDLTWLETEIAQNPKAKIIIITHHAPFADPQQNLTEGEYTDLTHLIRAPIVAWGYGHTHQYYQNQYGGVKLHNHPVGYNCENLGELTNISCQLP